MLEVEDKYRVHPDFVLPGGADLTAAGGPVAAVRGPHCVSLVAVYHDTADLRLARSGFTLRHRSGDGSASWQLKVPVSGRPGTRHEIDEPGPPDAPPEALRQLVSARVRKGVLAARATVRTERTTYDLLDADGELLAELTDDRVDAHGQRGPAARFREIEVEDKGGGSTVLDHIGALLVAAGAVRGEFRPKVVRALGDAATEPPDPPLPQAVRKRDPARAVIASILLTHLHRLLDSDMALRLGDDDGVHQIRVSARRLRSALRDFDPVLDPSWSHDLQHELRWLADEMSAARDEQVVRARLLRAVDALPAEADAQAALTQITRVLDPRAQSAEQAVHDTLASPRYLDLLDRLVAGAGQPRASDEADRPAKKVLPGLVAASRKRLRKRSRRAIRAGDQASLHRARIAAKRTRYLAESLTPLYGKPAKKFARQVEAMHDLLGEHQDAMVAADVLRDIAATSRSTRAAFVLGLLTAGQLQDAASVRAEFARLAPDVVRPRDRRWALGS